MATQSTKAPVSKRSFATVAAMAPPSRSEPKARGKENEDTLRASLLPTHSEKALAIEGSNVSQLQRDLHVSMSRLSVKESAPASDILNEQAKTNIKRAGLRLDDDQTHLSSSTKAASLDGKSTTSGTTFALDEKESLRPDDSASVKAAEDEDFGSGPASGAPNSRVGSEAGGRAFRDQFSEISESFATGSHRSHPLSRRIIAGIEEEGPQSANTPLVANLPPPIHIPRPDVAVVPPTLIDIAHREPDEKLFEALESPKDRMFLLRLEQDIITFVKDSTEMKIDLPPCNSFCRLLAHKLADYYALTHFVDNAVSSVTLYRTPYCRIPAPLSTLAKTQSLSPSASGAAAQPTMKIMRRPGLGKDSPNTNSGAATTESSIAASKAGSETGDEGQQGTGAASPADSSIAKDRGAMTRAEREARYKEKREELFGPQSENVDSNEPENEVSRTSSRNEDKKKKKRPKNNDDGFEARSQFNAYYPNMQYAAIAFDQEANPAAYFNPYISEAGIQNQSGVMGPSILQSGFQQNYPPLPSMQGYPPVVNPNPMMNPCNGPGDMQGYDQQTPTQFFSVLQQAPLMGQPPPAMSSPAMHASMSRPQSLMADQQWQASIHPYNYQQPRDPQQYGPAAAPPVPYAYGQLPSQHGMPGGKAAHPLPGSYSRQQPQFNPQTRAFIPNTGQSSSTNSFYANIPNHSLRPSSTTGHANGQQYSSPTPTYLPMPAKTMSGAYDPGHDAKNHSIRKSSVKSAVNASNGSPVQSTLSKWGVPANLPPKPPPPEPSLPENPHSLPVNNFNAIAQQHPGGQTMPNYHNGVYTIPGLGPQ